MSDPQGYMITTDEFAYAALTRAGMLALLDRLAAGPSDGVDAYQVERVPDWDGIEAVTAAHWAVTGEGQYCRKCCKRRMDGIDAAGRPAFLRHGGSCKAHRGGLS